MSITGFRIRKVLLHWRRNGVGEVAALQALVPAMRKAWEPHDNKLEALAVLSLVHHHGDTRWDWIQACKAQLKSWGGTWKWAAEKLEDRPNFSQRAKQAKRREKQLQVTLIQGLFPSYRHLSHPSILYLQ